MAHRLALAFGLYVAHVSISESKRSISQHMVVPDYFGFFSHQGTGELQTGPVSTRMLPVSVSGSKCGQCSPGLKVTLIR